MVRPSVILSVRYRNHFPVVQFQNQAHIWNPRGTGNVFKTIWGAKGTPNFFLFLFFRRRRWRKLTPRPGRPRRPKYGAPMAPQIWGTHDTPILFFCFLFLLPPPKAPKGGAEGTTTPEGEGNPAEDGCFASI